DDGTLLRLDPVRGKPLSCFRVARHGYDPGDGGLLRPRADDGRVGLVPQQKTEGADEDRLARPCFPAQDVQTAGEAHLQLVDDGVVMDVQLFKHWAPPSS